MFLGGAAAVLLFAMNLAGYAVSGDITYVSSKYGVVATGMAAVAMNVAVLFIGIAVGVIGWRKLRRG